MKANFHKKLDAIHEERRKLADSVKDLEFRNFKVNLSEQKVSSQKFIKSLDRIRTSSLFYDPFVDNSSNSQVFKLVKMVWKVKGSIDKVDKAKSFVPKPSVKKNKCFHC